MKLLKFEADWCGPCKIMKPVVEKLAAQYDLEVEVIDIDENPMRANHFRVQSIPTVVLMNGEEEVARVVGAKPMAKVASELGL